MSETAASTTTTTTPAPAATQAAADAAAVAAATQATTVTKNEGAVKTAEQIAAEAAAKPPADAVYTLALPKDAVIEASAVERMTAFAKAHTLSPAAAQTALDMANAEVLADRTRQEQATAATFKTLATETWPNEIKASKEFGGEKYSATVEECKRAAEKAWTPDERKILNDTGWGNHPLLVAGMARLGRMMKDDTLIIGGIGGGDTRRAADVLYGGTKATQ